MRLPKCAKRVTDQDDPADRRPIASPALTMLVLGHLSDAIEAGDHDGRGDNGIAEDAASFAYGAIGSHHHGATLVAALTNWKDRCAASDSKGR